MDLTTFWFLLIAVLWTGYLVLEGFDFGVGILMPVVGRTRDERRQALRTIGPFWDGNEVWLIVAGGATFAAFPEWYATLFSGYYIPLLLILLSLIVRIMGLEYRSKHDDPTWQSRWDVAIVVSSFLPAVLWGVAFANIVGGSPLDAEGTYVGTFFDLLHPYALLGGAVTLLLFLLHGAHFLSLKAEGPVRARATRLATLLWLPTVLAVVAFALWTLLGRSDGVSVVALVGTAAAAVALLAVLPAHRTGREGWAFVGTTVAIVGAVALLFGTLFPNVMTSSGAPGTDLTIVDAASTGYTLTVMTVVAVVMTPLVVLYQGWTYWVFRARVSPEGFGDVRNPLDLLDADKRPGAGGGASGRGGPGPAGSEA